MAKFLLPDESDQRILRELVRQVRTGRLNPQIQNVPPTDDPQAPETYIALPPDDGIPALIRIGTAAIPQEGDSPGTANCDIYNISSAGGLTKVGTVSEKVYNLTTTLVQQDWIIVIRTKFGLWVIPESTAVQDSIVFKEGILAQSLSPATSANDGPSTANLTVYGPPDVGTGGWVPTGETISVVNRLTEVDTIPIGTWLGVVATNNEFRPVVSDCGITTLA